MTNLLSDRITQYPLKSASFTETHLFKSTATDFDEVKKKIAIIGAGIYGCHLALTLKKLGYEIDLYDMSEDIFSGASTYNSFRIHKGYHYPRSGKTREMCLRDESEFIKQYGHLTSTETENPKLFCIANDERTLIDFSTMKTIMEGSGLIVEEIDKNKLSSMGFKNIEGGFKVFESIFLVDKAKKWFKSELNNCCVNLKLNNFISEIQSISNEKILVDNKSYDFVINCTYNQALSYYSKRHCHYFDLCFSLIIATKQKESKNKIYSFGIFDGAYPSIEPYGYDQIPKKYRKYYDKKLFQIFHVKHTSVNQYSNIDEARGARNDGLRHEKIIDLTEKILLDVRKFYPRFDKEFEVIDHCLSLKTKVNDLSDARPLIVLEDFEKHPNFIQVFSSKLTSIFTAEEHVLQLIKKLPHKNLLVA